jgi:hypothetical protein
MRCIEFGFGPQYACRVKAQQLERKPCQKRTRL